MNIKIMSLVLGAGVLCPYVLYPADLTSQARANATSKRDGIKESVPCGVTNNQKSYDDALTRFGWGKYGNRRPAIDWSKEFAVIIAPDTFDPKGDIHFISLISDDAAKILRVTWGFKKRPPSERVGASSASFGSQGPSEPEVLVISIPSSLAQGVSVICAQAK